MTIVVSSSEPSRVSVLRIRGKVFFFFASVECCENHISTLGVIQQDWLGMKREGKKTERVPKSHDDSTPTGPIHSWALFLGVDHAEVKKQPRVPSV